MPNKRNRRVVVADDHPVFRAGMRQVIESETGFEVVGEAADGEQALELCSTLSPDIAVLDINMPGLSGIEVAERLRGTNPSLRVVILSMQKEEQTLNKALNVGVSGYVLKEDAAGELGNCLARVARNQPYVSPSLTGFLLRRRSRAEDLASRSLGLNDLTTAERRILKRVAQKMSTKEIAAELFLSPRTVEAHRANICSKLSLQGANSLLVYAMEHRDELNCLA